MNDLDGYEEVEVPDPPRVDRKMEPAWEARRLRRTVHKTMLLETLRRPPSDYNGSNEKLAGYVGVSVRTVIRLLKQLEKDGAIAIRRSTGRTPDGFRSDRTIHLKKR